MHSPSRLMSLSVVLLRIALLVFPSRFRQRCGVDLLDLYRDRWIDATRRDGWLAGVRLFFKSFVNLLTEGARERFSAQSRPRSPSHQPASGYQHSRELASPRGSGSSRHRTGIRDDFVNALRALRRRPALVLATALPIGLGIGASTAVFTVVDSVVLRPLPYLDSEQLYLVGTVKRGNALSGLTPANFADLENDISSFEYFAVAASGRKVLVAEGRPSRILVGRVSVEFFDVFGTRAAVGRLFDEVEFTQPRVAVLSWSVWRNRWGGDPDIVGRTLIMDDRPYTVVGVLPADFVAPERMGLSAAGIWIPLDVRDPDWERTRAFDFVSNAAARLAPGVGIAAAREELNTLFATLVEAHPDKLKERDGTPKVLDARSLHRETVGDIRTELMLLAGSVVLLLLIACANVANLLLARSSDRSKEMAVRAAMGAGRGRLIVQLLIESVLIAALGGLLGIGLAHLGVSALTALQPDLPRLHEVRIDTGVLVFGLILSLATGLIFGLVPAIGASRRNPGSVLKERAAPTTAGENPMRMLLLVGQTALALVLVTGSGLLLNSFVRLQLVDPGFDPHNVMTMSVALGPLHASPEERSQFSRALAERLSSVPGVRSVSGSVFMPLGSTLVPQTFSLDSTDEPVTEMSLTVLPGFFKTLGIPLLDGRSFNFSDMLDTPRSVVVNERFADKLWPGENVIGKRFEITDGIEDGTVTVIGVVGNMRHDNIREPAAPMLYESFQQVPWLGGISMLVKYEGTGGELTQAMRRALEDVAPTLPVAGMSTMQGELSDMIGEVRFYLLLLGTFSGVALVLAAVGVYATMSYSVARRSREIGIRIALGAGAGTVLRMVMTRGVLQSMLGVLIGLAGSVAATQVLSSYLFQIEATDPGTLIATSTFLTAVALAACYIPGRRATRVDPLTVIREE